MNAWIQPLSPDPMVVEPFCLLICSFFGLFFVFNRGQVSWTCIFVGRTRRLRYAAKGFHLGREVLVLPTGFSFLSITQADSCLKTTQHKGVPLVQVCSLSGWTFIKHQRMAFQALGDTGPRAILYQLRVW